MACSRYILVGGQPVKEPDLLKWSNWMRDDRSGHHERYIKEKRLRSSRVSTVFLGLDHQFGEGPPLLFETVVFNGKLDQEQERYSTLADALAGHKRMVQRVRRAK